MKNQHILALSIAGLMAVMPMTATQAKVKLWGKVQAELNSEDVDGNDATIGLDDDAGRSRWGISASEKIGGGMTAFAKLAFTLDPADNKNEGNRAQYVGLKGGWGSFSAGRHPSPYKKSGGTSYDPFAATHLQARRAGGMSGNSNGFGHNGFVSNSLVYKSPSFSGITFDAMIVPDETAAGVDGDMDLSLNVKYNMDNLEVFVAYNTLNTAKGQEDESMGKVGGRFKMGNHTFAAQYEWISDSSSAATGAFVGSGLTYSGVTAGEDGQIWYAGYQLKMGHNILAAQLGQTDSDNGNDTDYWAIGFIHKFSKTARVFGGFAESDSDTLADRNVWTLGLRKDF